MKRNMSNIDRIIRVIVAALFAWLYFSGIVTGGLDFFPARGHPRARSRHLPKNKFPCSVQPPAPFELECEQFPETPENIARV